MKKFLILIFLVLGIMVYGQAQDSTELKEYVGSYTFPEGSAFTSAQITWSGGVLTASSSQGSSPLERKAKDTFALTNYDGGMLYFFRNSSGKVDRIKVAVSDVLLEGTKDKSTSWIQRKRYFDEDENCSFNTVSLLPETEKTAWVRRKNGVFFK